MYLGLQNSPHKRKTDTRRRDPSDWEDSPPTSVPTPVLVSVERKVNIMLQVQACVFCLDIWALISAILQYNHVKSKLFLQKPIARNYIMLCHAYL